MRLTLTLYCVLCFCIVIAPSCKSDKKNSSVSTRTDSVAPSPAAVNTPTTTATTTDSVSHTTVAVVIPKPVKAPDTDKYIPEALDMFSALVDVAEDTVLQTPGGAFIHIPAFALDAGRNKTVRLEIREALKMSDIIRAGLLTQTDGKPLSSGGMIQIEAAAGQSVKIIKTIGVSIPTAYVDPNMQVYKGVKEGAAVKNWTDPQPLIKNAQTLQIDTGKKLFIAHCASCHGIDKPITGPALAYISRLRNANWLYAYTRNHQVVADSVDRYALCLNNVYEKALRPGYRNWSDQQISAMYNYIDNESKKLRLPQPADHLKKCVDSCIRYAMEYDRLTKHRRNLVVENGSRLEKTSVNPPIPIRRDKKRDPDNYIPADRLQKVNAPYYESVYYQFNIKTFGWYNIDVLVSETDGVKKSELMVRLQGAYTSEMNVFLVLPSAKVFQEGGPLSGKENLYGFYTVDGSIYLQQSVKATVLTMGEKGGKIFFDMVSFQTSEKQTISITPAEVTKDQMNNMLKTLDLQNINIQAQDSKNADLIRATDVQLKDLEVLKPKTCNCDCGRILDTIEIPKVRSRL